MKYLAGSRELEVKKGDPPTNQMQGKTEEILKRLLGEGPEDGGLFKSGLVWNQGEGWKAL